VLAGAAVSGSGGKVKDEQETLIALADVAIGVFAIESAVLRAEKIAASGTLPRGARRRGRQGVFAFPASEAAISGGAAARRSTRRGEHAADAPISGIPAATRYDASGLLDAKHKLAAAALESERYPF